MKRIEVVTLKVSDLKFGFGNPRKITPKKKDELRQSLEQHGDFGIFVIDEENNIIAGNQRATVLFDINPDAEVTCKRLCGYSRTELKAINIKDNTHAGEWDLNILADWTSDIMVDLGLDNDVASSFEPEDRKLDKMEPIRYEKYDYVMIVCKNEIDYGNLIDALGIEGKVVQTRNNRTIKARAVWFDDMKAQIVKKGEEQ